MNNSRPEKPNFLLIVLDSVRARNTSLHGYSRPTTPFLNQLSDRITFYEQARSPSIWSLPSHVSMFSGEPAHVHGVNEISNSINPDSTIWRYLSKEFEYNTGLFTSNAYLTEVPVGLRECFNYVKGREKSVPFPKALTPKESTTAETYSQYITECFEDDYPIRAILNGVYQKTNDIAGIGNLLNVATESVHCRYHTENLIDWIDQQNGPWATCVNFMDAHLPYNPDKESNKWGDEELFEIQRTGNQIWGYVNGDNPWWKRSVLENLYDGTIYQMDRQIKTIVRHLRETGEYENTHIVITADHGEGFGEYSRIRPDVRYAAHAYGIHEHLLHVPLLVKKPHQEEGARISNLATLTDYYDEVKRTVEHGSEDSTVGFTADKVAVSSIERTQQLDGNIGDESEYRGDAFALYLNSEECIKKFVKWGEDEIRVNFDKSPWSPMIAISEENHGQADELARQARLSSSSKHQDSIDKIDSETKQRLEDLGYK